MKAVYLIALMPLLSTSVYAQAMPKPSIEEVVLGVCARAVQGYFRLDPQKPLVTSCFDEELHTMNDLGLLKLTIDKKAYATSIEFKSGNFIRAKDFYINLKSSNLGLSYFEGNHNNSRVKWTYIAPLDFSLNDLSPEDAKAVELALNCYSGVLRAYDAKREFDIFKKPTTCNDKRIIGELKELGVDTTLNSRLTSEIAGQTIGKLHDFYVAVNVKSQSGRWFSLSLYIDKRFSFTRFPVLAQKKARLSW